MASLKPIPVELKPKRYYVVLGILAVLHAPFVVLLFLQMLNVIHLGVIDTWNLYCVSALFLTYDIVSIRSVENNESAGITVLQREAIETGRGPKFIPYGIVRLQVVPRALQEDQFPSDPENISRKPDNGVFAAGMFEPMRITTG